MEGLQAFLLIMIVFAGILQATANMPEELQTYIDQVLQLDLAAAGVIKASDLERVVISPMSEYGFPTSNPLVKFLIENQHMVLSDTSSGYRILTGIYHLIHNDPRFRGKFIEVPKLIRLSGALEHYYIGTTIVWLRNV